VGKPPKAVLAPRPAPDPAAIEAFISGKAVQPAAAPAPRPEPVLAPEPPRPPPIAYAPQSPPVRAYPVPAAAPKRTVIRRKDGRELYRTTIYLTPELAQRMGIFAVKQGVDQTEIIKAALGEYLARHGG
jgi:hypothetical protein